MRRRTDVGRTQQRSEQSATMRSKQSTAMRSKQSAIRSATTLGVLPAASTPYTSIYAGLACPALSQLRQHCRQGLLGVGRLADRPADHQIIGTGLQGLRRGQDASLVILRAASGANPRGD
jgi:hypothetical protein